MNSLLELLVDCCCFAPFAAASELPRRFSAQFGKSVSSVTACIFKGGRPNELQERTSNSSDGTLVDERSLRSSPAPWNLLNLPSAASLPTLRGGKRYLLENDE